MSRNEQSACAVSCPVSRSDTNLARSIFTFFPFFLLCRRIVDLDFPFFNVMIDPLPSSLVGWNPNRGPERFSVLVKIRAPYLFFSCSIHLRGSVFGERSALLQICLRSIFSNSLPACASVFYRKTDGQVNAPPLSKGRLGFWLAGSLSFFFFFFFFLCMYVFLDLSG